MDDLQFRGLTTPGKTRVVVAESSGQRWPLEALVRGKMPPPYAWTWGEVAEGAIKLSGALLIASGIYPRLTWMYAEDFCRDWVASWTGAVWAVTRAEVIQWATDLVLRELGRPPRVDLPKPPQGSDQAG